MPPAPPLLLLRTGEGVFVGHIAVGNGVARLGQQRAEDPLLSHTWASLGAGEAVHGANAAGLVCVALDPPGHPLVRTLLGGAHSVHEAHTLLDDLPRERRGHPATLLLADSTRAARAELTADGAPTIDAADAPPAPAGDLTTRLHAALRAMEPAPREGAVPACALAALLVPGAPPTLHLALGPPSCAVFVRHWPGMELVADETAAPEGAPLARLAAAVAQATSTDAELRRAARERLDRAELEALHEGEAAERMAARMDADTDDRGAAVRRLVAQSHAVELARRALEELAVPRPRL